MTGSDVAEMIADAFGHEPWLARVTAVDIGGHAGDRAVVTVWGDGVRPPALPLAVDGVPVEWRNPQRAATWPAATSPQPASR